MFRLRGWIDLHLLRLKYKLEFRAARKSVQLRNLCCLLVDAEIRALKPDLLQLGEDERLDHIVEYVAGQLMNREALAETLPVSTDDLVFELIQLAQKSDNVQIAIARYHATEAFFSDIVKDEARKDGQLVLARTASPTIVEYDAGAVYKEYGLTVARHDKLRKQLAERSAFKMEFSVAGISSGIALITTIFVVSGFLYIHYFYRRMGVDVSNFFSVADYLAASVEQK